MCFKRVHMSGLLIWTCTCSQVGPNARAKVGDEVTINYICDVYGDDGDLLPGVCVAADRSGVDGGSVGRASVRGKGGEGGGGGIGSSTHSKHCGEEGGRGGGGVEVRGNRRRELLWERYGFWCKCTLCTDCKDCKDKHDDDVP